LRSEGQRGDGGFADRRRRAGACDGVGDRTGALWAQCLRVIVPGATAEDRRELAALLAANGRFDAAAEELDAIADDGWGSVRDRAAARRMRAKLN